MIVREFYREREDGIKLYRTFSSENKYIRKVGTTDEYSEAVDVEGASYQYEETDRDVEEYEELNVESYEKDSNA